MSMDIFEDLLTGSGSNQISAELLETLGNQAARRHLEDGDNLNETIRELVAQHSGMKNEHTKRIAEFANNQVFQEMHTKSDDKNVHFDIADPGVIIRDLKDGGSPKHDGKTLSVGSEKESDLPSGGGDYRRPPGDEMSPSTEQGFADLDSAFMEHSRQDQNSGVEGTGEQIAKTASLADIGVDHQLHANPIDNVYDVHVRLRAAKEKLAEAHETFDLLYKAAEDEYYLAAKKEVLGHGGSGMAGVIQATKLAAPSDSVAFKALRKVAERMVGEGIPSTILLKMASDEMILNPEHPLVQAFAGLIKLADERARSSIALADVREGLEKTGAFLQSVA